MGRTRDTNENICHGKVPKMVCGFAYWGMLDFVEDFV